MKIEDDFIFLEESDFLPIGAHCSQKATRLGDRAPFMTRVVAWCYEDWRAQTRADDDGWIPRW